MNGLAEPWALALVAVPAALLLARRLAWADGTRRLAQWPGIDKAVSASRTTPVVRLAALACVALGVAGLRQAGPTSTPTRDVVFVLDVSRSMTAEQPTRLERAARAIRAVADAAGPDARVALVAVAARAEVVSPLTRDVRPASAAVARIARDRGLPATLPPADEPLISGTRLGAGLRAALALLPARRPGAQRIVLVSDGDDPVDDGEALGGAEAARARSVAVDVVPVGEADATIPVRNQALETDGAVVRSRVRVERLEAIATRTGGRLAIGEPADVAREVTSAWPALEAGDADVEIASFPRAHRAAPFALALVLWLGAGVSWPRSARVRLAGLASVALALVAAGGASPEWMRRGDAAFARGDFPEAARCYRAALDDASAPGEVAFNLGAALFRAGKAAEAEAAYRMALADAEFPHRARAWFDVAAAALAQAPDAAPDRDALERAAAALRRCLATDADHALRRDVERNLALVAARWARATAREPKTGDGSDGSEPPRANGKEAPGQGKEDSHKTPDSGDGSGKQGDGKEGGSGRAARGQIVVLPDRSERIALTPAEALEHLERQVERIERERDGRVQSFADRPARARDW